MAPVDKKQTNKYLSSQVQEMLDRNRENSSSSDESENSADHKKTKKAKAIKTEKADRKNVMQNITNKKNLPSTSNSNKKRKEEFDGPSTSQQLKKRKNQEKNVLSNAQKQVDKEKALLCQSLTIEERKSSSSSENDTDDEDIDLILQNEVGNEQLFGKNYEDNMVHIGKGVYCRYNNIQYAMSSSSSTTSLARKLMEGVYKKEALLKSTFTGLPARSQGRDRQNVVVMPLDYKAKMAIIAFAIKVSKNKKMVVNPVDAICRSMSQHIGEIKRDEQRKKLALLN